MAGPAAAAAGALSGTEKEKLREKLALLRQEYSETVRRLRRARRAERARSHGLGTAAEGDRRERCPAGSKDNISPSADEHESSQLQTETCSGLDREKKTSVPSKPLLKLPSNEVILQDSSHASQENLCCGVLSPVSEEKKAQTSRGLMKLRRKTKALVPEQKAAAREVHPVSTDETVTNQTATMEGLQSPVFIRSRPLNIEEISPRALVQREDNSFTSSDAAVRDTREDSVPQGVPELFPCVQGDSSHVWQPESPSMVAPCDSHEPVWLSSENGNAVFLETSGNGGEESLSIIKQTPGESLHEDQRELQKLLDFVSENEVLPADGSSTVTDKSKSLERHHRDTNSLESFHTDLALGNVEGPLETQQLGVQSQLSHPEKMVAPESALTSCTVVEGLLFPVEYYVRTTRRMSSCQRKVDLDAVILSQLGRSKKGQRIKCRQKDANSSQERAENDLELGVALFPFLGAENDPATSGSSQKSLPASSGSSTSLGSISQTSITSRMRGQKRSQGKQKGRRKSACKRPGHQVSQELVQGLPFLAPGEGSSLLINECQSKKENCKANLEKSSLDDRCLSGAAASGSGEEGTGTVPPTATDPPGGNHALGKCCKTLLEKLQNSPSLGPGNETSASHSKDLEANIAAAPQADNRPAEQARNRCGWGARSAEQLLVAHAPVRHSPRYWAGRRAGQVPKDESSRGHSYLLSPDGPASLDLPAVDSETCNSLFSFRCLQWLAPTLGVREFDLPDEEFGQLKFEKLESSPMNNLEVFVPSVFEDDVASEDTQDAQINPEEKTLKSNLPSLFNNGSPKLPHIEGPASKRDLSTHELLFTPMGTVLAGAPTQLESEMSSSVFPVVGATPAVSPAVRSELFPSSPSAPPLQARSPSFKAASAQAMGDGECKDSDILLHLDSSGLVSARKEEEQGAAFLLEAERGLANKSDESVSLEKHQQSESEQQRSCRAPSEQKKDAAGQLAPGLLDGLLEESLQLVSKLKDSSGSCSVDVSTMWWEAAGCRELCVVTAEASSVSLWKPLASDRWGKVHTWQLGEIPVIQIIPLPDTCNLVCIALGDLEIGEIRLLLYSSENDSFNQSLMKTGTIKAVLGLKDRRLVSSSRTVQEQQVEIVSLSETGGSKDGQTLMPPEETVLAFAEVEGMREALVGATAVNSIVVWNLKTGQLLKKMHVGYSYPASICHRAYSDLGLLFVVLSHPHAKESESCGNPAFRVVAFNPKTARSTGVMFSSLPPAHAGRYLEGDVKDTSAAAVLTSGAIAVWDLLLGRCTALLPPGPGGSWALVRWATTSACLLAGQQDGTVCLYQYHQPQTSAA